MSGITLSLAGCNALVTGASSGLGTFLAEALDAAGASVAIHYHTKTHKFWYFHEEGLSLY